MMNITNNPAWDDMPTISSDGTKLAFVSNRKGPGISSGLFMIEVGELIPDDNSIILETVELVNTDKYEIRDPKWSPMGNWIVYISNYADKSFVDLVDVDSKTTWRIFSKYQHNEYAIWAKNDNVLYIFIADEEDGNYGYVIHELSVDDVMNNKQPKEYQLENKYRVDPNISINENKELLLTMTVDNNDAIYKVQLDLEDGIKKIINKVGETEFGSVWSPDSKWIFYKSSFGNRISAYLYNLESQKETLLYSTNYRENIDAMWSTDSKQLAYTTYIKEKFTYIDVIYVEYINTLQEGCEMAKKSYGPISGLAYQFTSWV